MHRSWTNHTITEATFRGLTEREQRKVASQIRIKEAVAQASCKGHEFMRLPGLGGKCVLCGFVFVQAKWCRDGERVKQFIAGAI